MGWRLRHLPTLLLVSAASLVGAAVVGGVVGGADDAVGAAGGVALVVTGYVFSTLVVAWADVVAPHLVLPLGLAAYVTKLGVVVAVMVAVSGSGRSNVAPVSAGIIAGVVAWTSAHVWWVARHGQPSGGASPPVTTARDEPRGGQAGRTVD